MIGICFGVNSEDEFIDDMRGALKQQDMEKTLTLYQAKLSAKSYELELERLS